MAIQDYYPENLAYCYGCGRLNDHGHHIRTDWDGDETVCAEGVTTARGEVVAIQMPDDFGKS